MNCIVINKEQAIEMPKEGKNNLKFINYHKQLNHAPFVIYADFEAILRKMHTVSPSDKKSYTNAKP